MADEIDTRVTPSFHPETVQAIAEYDDDTSSILAGTVSAFSEAYIAVGRVHDASAASKTNPAWNEAAALIHTADFADKLTLQLAKRFDSATAGLSRVIEGLEAELSQPIEGQGVGAMAGEIRAFVRGMSDGERMGFIRKAIAYPHRRGGASWMNRPLTHPVWLHRPRRSSRKHRRKRVRDSSVT